MEDPYGMLYIPMGSYNMGPSDQDVPYALTTQAKTVSVQAFYMDETEITNNEKYHGRENRVDPAILSDVKVEHAETTRFDMVV